MFLTFLLLGANYTLLIHQAKNVVDRRGKVLFDAVSTGLVLGLGLNFTEVFRDMAKITRWRILSSRCFGVRETDLILGAESLMKVLQMTWEFRRKPRPLFVCLFWLLVNVGAQISVAVMPLFTALKSGYDSKGTTISPGDVSVPKLDCFYRSGMEECAPNQDLLDPAVAHTYGELGASSSQKCGYDSFDDIINGPQSCPYLPAKMGANLPSVTPIQTLPT